MKNIILVGMLAMVIAFSGCIDFRFIQGSIYPGSYHLTCTDVDDCKQLCIETFKQVNSNEADCINEKTVWQRENPGGSVSACSTMTDPVNGRTIWASDYTRTYIQNVPGCYTVTTTMPSDTVTTTAPTTTTYIPGGTGAVTSGNWLDDIVAWFAYIFSFQWLYNN